MVDVNVVMRNARPSGNGWSYLSIDQVMSIRVLEGEMIVYALLIAGLCGQIHHPVGFVLRKCGLDCATVGQVRAQVGVVWMT
jgi:hypothetical protein